MKHRLSCHKKNIAAGAEYNNWYFIQGFTLIYVIYSRFNSKEFAYIRYKAIKDLENMEISTFVLRISFYWYILYLFIFLLAYINIPCLIDNNMLTTSQKCRCFKGGIQKGLDKFSHSEIWLKDRQVHIYRRFLGFDQGNSYCCYAYILLSRICLWGLTYKYIYK